MPPAPNNLARGADTPAQQPPGAAAARMAAACLTTLAFHATANHLPRGRHRAVRLLRHLTPDACARVGLATDETVTIPVLALALHALVHHTGVRPRDLAMHLDTLTAGELRDLLSEAHSLLNS